MLKLALWVKQNKLVVLLTLVILFLLSRNNLPIATRSSSTLYKGVPSAVSDYSTQSVGLSSLGGGGSMMERLPQPSVAPAPEVLNRKVVSTSYLSLVTKSVSDTSKQITAKAKELGGYMVSSNLETPAEAASATVVVRVPSKSFDSALTYFKSLSLKVVSENLTGYDVTDQYVDLDARLTTLNKTKEKFEGILNSAVLVQDILTVQREIISLQSQIDAVKGQQQYLDKTAENALITVYLSTDEFALPYAPTDTWRAEVIFKQAVRSIIGTGRSAGSFLIWVGVYSVVWVPILIVVILLKKRVRRSAL